ncbi:mannose-6-phosphate isomerase, class I [Natronosporangium hydrolyticum]|uniref:mannose-6-phosphate isomerase n=1 Tax=Natronosporangium hydrolyticum TaxID=2811111 RepID=A0A895YER4_9ACTN|nr:mannose-6-phosphate isomerase, class I [Natronosporangium hydrolyticum]QSB13903.1 mannose-6-phosphate isomerase, class I [Natronosporangium hydrolyticum]
MRRLENPIRDYAWGSRTAIAQIQGRPVPSAGPEAELWIGAHPAGPSRLVADDSAAGRPLTAAIEAAPERVLTGPVVARFGARLPYLLKLLAAAAPLSLQAHPDEAQAAAGYAAEEAAGVPRDARHRRYVDPYHKPELLVAVSDFRALCGFREPAISAELLAELAVPELAPVAMALRASDLASAVAAVLAAPEPAKLVAAVAAAGSARWPLVAELTRAYPGDLGVVVALLLNEVTLAPGEAIFMPAGNLHAYLAGTGVEIMAASDNVLRGGLTTKYVDVPELLRVLRFEPLPDPVLTPVPVAAGVVTWPVPVAEFALHRVRLSAGVGQAELTLPGPRSVLCLAGEVRVADGEAPVTLRAGEVAFGSAELAAAGGLLQLAGEGEVFVASVGDASVG